MRNLRLAGAVFVGLLAVAALTMQFAPAPSGSVAPLRSTAAVLALLTGLAAVILGIWSARSRPHRVPALLVVVLGLLQVASALDLWGQPLPTWVAPVLLVVIGGIALALGRRVNS